jgi:predicted membrane metal-binding protein
VSKPTKPRSSLAECEALVISDLLSISPLQLGLAGGGSAFSKRRGLSFITIEEKAWFFCGGWQYWGLNSGPTP